MSHAFGAQEGAVNQEEFDKKCKEQDKRIPGETLEFAAKLKDGSAGFPEEDSGKEAEQPKPKRIKAADRLDNVMEKGNKGLESLVGTVMKAQQQRSIDAEAANAKREQARREEREDFRQKSDRAHELSLRRMEIEREERREERETARQERERNRLEDNRRYDAQQQQTQIHNANMLAALLNHGKTNN